MPNPEVKPPSADGTAGLAGGRAGRRRPALGVTQSPVVTSVAAGLFAFEEESKGNFIPSSSEDSLGLARSRGPLQFFIEAES